MINVRKERLQNITKLAQDAFSTHQYKKISDCHWCLQREDGDSCFWCDIAVFGESHIVITGDIDVCVFAYYSGENGPQGAVRWIADSYKRGSWGYISEKASIGMSGLPVNTVDDDVFAYDLTCYLEDSKRERTLNCDDCKSDEDFNENICKLCEYNIPEHEEKALTEALEMWHNKYGAYSREDIIEFLNEELCDRDAWEWTYNLGEVIDSRVIYAACALCRLVELWDEGKIDESL